jgi:polysaccharide biosynthesis/export protein
MKTSKLILSTGFVAAVIALSTGCQGTGPTFDARAPAASAGTVAGVTVTNELDSALLQGGMTAFTVGPGDVLECEVLGSPNSRATLTVGPDGKVYFQMLNGLDVWGLTLSETKELLQKELTKYVTGAQVSVALRTANSKSVWLLGQVHKPGVYPMTGPMTLLEGVALAGGTLDQADLRHSFVQRAGRLLPVDFQRLLRDGDMSQNIYVQADDFVYLPSSQLHEVFVLGAVRAPRTVPYSDRLTVLSAVAAASGPMPGAYMSHVAIVRGSLAEPKVALVDYKAIVSGKEPDVRLEAHDVVYVPFEPFSGLKSYARSILSTFVNTVAANEGINAVIKDGGGVGIAVGPGGATAK